MAHKPQQKNWMVETLKPRLHWQICRMCSLLFTSNPVFPIPGFQGTLSYHPSLLVSLIIDISFVHIQRKLRWIFAYLHQKALIARSGLLKGIRLLFYYMSRVHSTVWVFYSTIWAFTLPFSWAECTPQIGWNRCIIELLCNALHKKYHWLHRLKYLCLLR